MRLLMIAVLLGGAAALSGCGSSQTDPYRNMEMLPPEAAGGSVVEEDPVLEQERAFNAQFARKGTQKR